MSEVVRGAFCGRWRPTECQRLGSKARARGLALGFARILWAFVPLFCDSVKPGHIRSRGPGRLEPEHHLPGDVGLHALVGQRGAGDVAAQLFQRLAATGRAAHGSVQAEAVVVCAQRLVQVRLSRHRPLHFEHLLAGARTEGEAVVTCGCLQLRGHLRGPRYGHDRPLQGDELWAS